MPENDLISSRSSRGTWFDIMLIERWTIYPGEPRSTILCYSVYPREIYDRTLARHRLLSANRAATRHEKALASSSFRQGRRRAYKSAYDRGLINESQLRELIATDG